MSKEEKPIKIRVPVPPPGKWHSEKKKAYKRKPKHPKKEAQ